jgi:glycosyltransferase involved in cell wall biosynthesis
MRSSKEALVSVVMVTRNVDRFLSEAIESILEQTFHDFEFIIADFGSTDKSKDIASSYAAKDSRISFVRIPNCSLAKARNAVCALATGRYIAIQDADDISLPNRLKLEVDFMEQHPEVGLLGGAVHRIDQNGKFLSAADHYPTEDQAIRLQLKEWNTFCQPSVVMLRRAFVHVGGYRAAYPNSEDYDLWLRISEYYQCANLKEIVLKYRIHPHQMTMRKRSEQILCTLAAQASASLRRAGKPDPMASANEITPMLLAAMGVSENIQITKLAEGYFSSISQMYKAGGNAAVHEAAAELFRLCKGVHAEPIFISGVHILVAKAYWKQRRILPSFLSLGRAVLARPRLVGRPLKPFLRLLRSA